VKIISKQAGGANQTLQYFTTINSNLVWTANDEKDDKQERTRQHFLEGADAQARSPRIMRALGGWCFYHALVVGLLGAAILVGMRWASSAHLEWNTAEVFFRLRDGPRDFSAGVGISLSLKGKEN
jgi:hypothetical protein